MTFLDFYALLSLMSSRIRMLTLAMHYCLLVQQVNVHNERERAEKLICLLQQKKIERKEKKEKKNKGKTRENHRKNQEKTKGNQGQPRRGGGRQPREGRKRGEAAVEGGESGGAATVRSHGSPPPPSCRYAVGKLPDLPFRISFNLDLKNSF